MHLTNRCVWLTGASTGIGEALVSSLVRRGARVGITARRAELLDAIVERHAAAGGTVVSAPADVTNRAAVAGAARRIEAALGPIDLAIFNAGGSRGRPVDPFDADAFVETMALNYFSVVYGIDAVLPGMLARRHGHIAAVASLAGYRGVPRAAHYSASKAALINLCESLRFELAPKGILVNVINPGFVRTPLTAPNRFRMPFLLEPERAAEYIAAGLERERFEIHFPAALSWPMKMMRVMPFGMYERLMGAFSRGGGRDE